MTSGIAMPAPQALFAQWSPPNERGKLAGVATSGITFGLIVSMPLTGVLVKLFGWEIQFYVIGGACLIWVPLWFWYARDSPSEMPSYRISIDELNFLKQFEIKREKNEPPWINFWLSLPVWGVLVGWFAHNYLMYNLLTSLPFYLSNVHGQNALKSGALTTLPYILKWLCGFIQAQFVSYILDKGNLFFNLQFKNEVNSRFCKTDNFTPTIQLNFNYYSRYTHALGNHGQV